MRRKFPSFCFRLSLASLEQRTICLPMVPASVPKTARHTCDSHTHSQRDKPSPDECRL